MVSRENRVILGSFLLFVAVVAGIAFADRRLGVSIGDAPLVGYLLLAGVAIVLPQLYLARTDDDVSPRYRIWFATVAAVGLAFSIVSDATGLQRASIYAIAGTVFLGAVCYEVVTGYRAARTDESPLDSGG
ncbi:hypothetical protein [Halosolutus halophilus]|uniref:hypothetical protein n=1 Tax=Halosolutus halophilus TaxID=1552990 RepID=UPI0022351C12|nr:hypothetical protein [Halosolutus halophilus]